MTRGGIVLVGLVVATACTSRPAETAKQDTLTTRERQEAVGNSGIPGARGINKALEIADSAQTRIQQLDTVGQ